MLKCLPRRASSAYSGVGPILPFATRRFTSRERVAMNYIIRCAAMPALSALCVLAAQAIVFGQTPRSPAAPRQTSAATAVPNQTAMLNELARTIYDAVRRSDTQHPVFHGCLDWHSAVHGHWALLRVAAITGRHDGKARWVVAALDPQRLAAEADYLRRNPQVEMPYGRAWFLRLAIEYESRPHAADQAGAKALANMADQVASSLWRFCKSRPQSPDTHEYDSDAWALVQLHDFYNHRQNNARRQAVDARIENLFAAANSPIRFADDHGRPEFFSPFGGWAYLLAKTQPTGAVRRFWRSHLPTDDELRPVQVRNANSLGTNWSRAWALRAVSRHLADPAERSRIDSAYRKHVAAGMATHANRKDDYSAYGHWAPQFAVYAITE